MTALKEGNFDDDMAKIEMRKWSLKDMDKTRVEQLGQESLASLVATFLVEFDEKRVVLFRRLKDALLSYDFSTDGSMVVGGDPVVKKGFVDSIVWSITQAPPNKGLREALTERGKAVIELLYS